MKKTIKSLKAEAVEHRIVIKSGAEKVTFCACDGTHQITWMHKNSSDNWTGFSRDKGATGRKRGTKAEVMDWCLDWAINGF